MAKTDYEFSDVLISPRAPYDKKTLWIHPTQDNIEIKLYYNNDWKTILQTKDTGLSDKAKNQVGQLNEEFKSFIIRIIKKQFGKFSSNNNVLLEKQKLLEERIQKLEDKIDKMNKKYSMIKQNG